MFVPTSKKTFIEDLKAQVIEKLRAQANEDDDNGEESLATSQTEINVCGWAELPRVRLPKLQAPFESDQDGFLKEDTDAFEPKYLKEHEIEVPKYELWATSMM